MKKTDSFEEKWLAGAKAKKIVPTIHACNDLIRPGAGQIELTYKNIEKEQQVKASHSISFKEDSKNGLGFTITNDTGFHVAGILYKQSYGLTKELKIKTDNGKNLYAKPNSVIDFKTDFSLAVTKLEGKFNNIGTTPYNQLKGVFIRQLIHVTDTDMTFPTAILKETNFLKFDQTALNRQATLLGIPMMSKKGQYCAVKINRLSFDFYSIEGLHTQVIDSLETTDIETFKKTQLPYGNPLHCYLVNFTVRMYFILLRQTVILQISKTSILN